MILDDFTFLVVKCLSGAVVGMFFGFLFYRKGV